MKNTRKSVRIYVNQNDIKSGNPTDGLNDAIHVAMSRLGILKGKCFAVSDVGVHVGPNCRYLREYGLNKEPDLQLSGRGRKFVAEFDNKGHKTSPSHVTLIDKSGKYL